jgi:hypothetical protein
MAGSGEQEQGGDEKQAGVVSPYRSAFPFSKTTQVDLLST